MNAETTLLEYTIVIIDNDETTCEQLTRLLTSLGYKTKSFLSANDFLDSFERSNSKLCLLIALEMPGSMMLKFLKHNAVSLPIIFLGEQPSVENVVQVMQNGAFSVLAKPLSDAQVVDNINRAINWHTKQHNQVQQKVAIQSKFATLSPKEHTILELITDGLANKEIAKELSISIKTVEYHRNNLRQKLRAKSFADLIKLSLQYQQAMVTE